MPASHCYESLYGESCDAPQLVILVNNNPAKTGLFSGTAVARYIPSGEEGYEAIQFHECLFTHSRIGADLSGVELERYYSTAGGDTRSLLPGDFFRHPLGDSEEARMYERAFLEFCGLKD